ncbi:signal peptidase II [Kribbella sp. NPDC051952]|uniref:signal peptidase II n=1 Tax=Kribbella sp. NPDC051952 TaxID=3154851 RepID=UPI003430729D
MQRTRRTPLNHTPSRPAGDTDPTPEPADPQSAGSPSSPPPEPASSSDEGITLTTGGAAAVVASTDSGASGGGAAAPGVGDETASSSSSSSSEADVAGGGEAGKSWKWTVIFAVVGLVVLGLDQLTKALALAHLTPGEPVNVIGSLLKFNLIRNSGAAFSLGSGYTPYISAIQIAVAIGVVYLSRKLGSVGWAIAFGFLFGGAVGNIIDRIFRDPSPFHGHVVDFLQTPHWAIFNVADMAVTSAAILLVLQTLRGIRLDGTREIRK